MAMVRKIVIIILLILIIINLTWFLISKLSGPFIAFVFYAIILVLCWVKQHFQAGITGGIIGFLIHILELIFYNNTNLSEIESAFFWTNIILPVALVYFSYKANNIKNK